MTSLITIVTFVSLSAFVATEAALISHQKYFNTQVEDKEFTQFVVFERSSRSVTDCAVQCDMRDDCVSFTYHRQQGRCRAYSQLVTSDMPHHVFVGTTLFAQQTAGQLMTSDMAYSLDTSTTFSTQQTSQRMTSDMAYSPDTSTTVSTQQTSQRMTSDMAYSPDTSTTLSTQQTSQRMTSDMAHSPDTSTTLSTQQTSEAVTQPAEEWLDNDCTANTDCPAVNSECFAGQCLCTPGYYYSLSQAVCRHNCSALSVTYVRYDDRDLEGPILTTLAFVSDETSCVSRCNTEPECRVIVYDDEGGLWGRHCFLKTFTPLDFPDDWKVKSGVHVFQRQCL